MSFVTNCQMGSLLGSKSLGTKCIRTTSCIVLANHDQNYESRYRPIQSSFKCKFKSSNCRNLLCKSTKLDRLRIRFDQLKIADPEILQKFQT